MPNIDSVTEFFPTVFENTVAMTLSGTIAPGATTVGISGMTNYSNGDVVVFTVDAATPTLKQVFTGIVSGATVTNVEWTYGTNQTHTSGATVIDYVSATTLDMITAGILMEHNQNGTHEAISNTGGMTTDTLNVTTSATIKNLSPTGVITGWVSAAETWTYASASTITVPTNATTKYDIGDYLQLTQSSTVKYFVVTAVAATVLTIAGLAGATVANSAITLNSYSKTRNPHGALAGAIPFNPYKFSVYRNGAVTTSGTGFNLLTFDTELFDTGSNYSVSTGKFTAPVAGFYQLNANAGVSTSNIEIGLSFYKNGTEYIRGNENLNAAGTIVAAVSVSSLVQLAANDYIQVYFYCNSNGQTIQVGTSPLMTYFNGFLVSAI